MRVILANLFLAVCLFTAYDVQAHALWITTKPAGIKGHPHEVRIYYGEPSVGTVDPVSEWWSDVNAFELVLQLPDGSSQRLATTPGTDHFSASFTPKADGDYVLRIEHPVRETFDGHKYQFNSMALVSVGNGNGGAERRGLTEFHVLPGTSGEGTVGHGLTVYAMLNGKPVAEQEITVFSPNGWSKTFKTDEKGEVSFVPDREGLYVVEAIHSADVEGKDHKHLHRIATWSLTLEN